MPKVHDWKLGSYQPDPKHPRYVVDCQLREIRTTKDVFWSVNTNSYVLAKPKGDTKTFDLNGEQVLLLSINGAGEVRWDVAHWALENALQSEKKSWWEETFDGAEQLAAARHFGLIPQKNDLEKAQMIYDRAKKDLGSDLKGHSLLDLLADNMELPLSILEELAKKVER